MALFKFQNYSAIKNLQDNPRVVATQETVNGNVFSIVDNDEDSGYKEAAVPFADANAAKAGEVWVMMNIVDKPEIHNYADYSVKAGEYIRAVNLSKQVGEIVELSGDLVVSNDVKVGDTLVPCNVDDDATNPMSWKKVADASGYTCHLEVTDLTTFGLFTIDNAGVGYEAKIKSA